ncbi:MAG: bifunctional DNA-formamidopyrimidine glycosylase/DNA-(apurinic or apyrimidinic site) lyase, partial [Bilophila sp.]
MPELPEVETIARTLAPQVEGRVVTRCRLHNPSTLQGLLPLEAVTGLRIGTPGRRGKLLLVPLVSAAVQGLGTCAPIFAGGAKTSIADQVIGLGFHLKMTGRVFVHPAGTPPGVHTRLTLDLDDKTCLFFDDARKFGYVRVLSPSTLADWPFWNKLGPEPLDMSPEDFVACFANRRGAIKALLLNQQVLAGCGNIYADESLFRAGIRPDAPALTSVRLVRLHKALREVLLESIAACGSSIRDYRTARGDAGAFQNSFRVYGRASQPCLVCHTT